MALHDEIGDIASMKNYLTSTARAILLSQRDPNIKDDHAALENLAFQYAVCSKLPCFAMDEISAYNSAHGARIEALANIGDACVERYGEQFHENPLFGDIYNHERPLPEWMDEEELEVFGTLRGDRVRAMKECKAREDVLKKALGKVSEYRFLLHELKRISVTM